MIISDTPQLLLIDGKRVEPLSGRFFETRNPANGDLLAQVAEGDAADVDLAVAAARRAFESGPWPKMTPAERQAILIRLADLFEKERESLALMDTLDMGAPIRRTRGGVGFLADILRYFAGMARGIHGETAQTSIPSMFACTLKEPIGVVGAITPWNGPLWAAALKAGPILATGCTMVLKPAEESPLSALRLGELALEAGVPPGVLNVVTGFGEGAGARLVDHPDVDKIAFTGSDETGRKIVRASAGTLKRVTLELGGKSPHIIFADADLEKAAAAAAVAIFGNSGQVCSAGSRLFVERSVAKDFAEAVARHGATLKLGDGRDETTDLGPLVSAAQRDRVEHYIGLARGESAEFLAGGERPSGATFDKGFFYQPTVIAGLNDESPTVRDEIFGPVVCVLPFESEDEVSQRANASMFGLGAGVWTKDNGRALRMGRALKAGSVWVNCYNTIDPAVPSGGIKASGYGREYGREHLEDHLNIKSLWMQS